MSVYETCACVTINLLNYMCILRGVHVLHEALVLVVPELSEAILLRETMAY